jgi:hypothetical protein
MLRYRTCLYHLDEERVILLQPQSVGNDFTVSTCNYSSFSSMF